jgi:hypothetical protein
MSLPTAAARIALEWPSKVWRNPTAVKTARLRKDPGTAHAALELVRIKSNARGKNLGAG